MSDEKKKYIQYCSNANEIAKSCIIIDEFGYDVFKIVNVDGTLFIIIGVLKEQNMMISGLDNVKQTLP